MIEKDVENNAEHFCLNKHLREVGSYVVKMIYRDVREEWGEEEGKGEEEEEEERRKTTEWVTQEKRNFNFTLSHHDFEAIPAYFCTKLISKYLSQ